MCSVTDSIRRLFASNNAAATTLLGVLPPCLHGDGTKNIDIRIFDKDGLVRDMATSDEVVSDLQKFLRGLASKAVEQSTVAQLSQINFQVTYANRKPDQSEIDGFGVNVFPIYFLTATPPSNSSGADIISLLRSHKIPKLVQLAKRVGMSQAHSREFVYTHIAESWENKPDALGYGMSAGYFIQNNQQICRKLGIIKMQGQMIEKVQPFALRPKLVAVLRHEMGHMFGMDHEANTLMDASYDVNVKSPSYSPDQLWIMGRALEALLQS